MTDPKKVAERIQAALFPALVAKCPRMSGNMSLHITVERSGPDGFDIIIDAPFYDLARWRRDKAIVPTGESIGGVTSYAESVNRLGGFGSGNGSKGWVDRTILEAVTAVASQFGAEVIYEL